MVVTDHTGATRGPTAPASVAARRAAAAVAAAATVSMVGALLAGCVVNETEEDILEQAWRCEDDVDCTAGWECRAFAFDPDAQRYCVEPCEGDQDCLFDDQCSNAGFCVEPCDLDAPACRDPKYSCQRMNMTPGDRAGYCQPTDPCDSSSDCAAPFDQCLGPVLNGFFEDLTLDDDRSICLDSCAGKDCAEGYSCVKQVLQGFLPSQNVPELCVPRCGEDNACPPGFRCLLDALQEWFPGESFDENLTKVCAPGLSGLGLPCRSDQDCLTGRCVKHPTQTLKGGGDYHTCALPCETTCEDVRTDCLQTQHEGQTTGFCFQPFEICNDQSDCDAPQRCVDFSNVNIGKICATPCNGPRDPTSCTAGFTCIPDASGTESACFFGLPGFPCADTNQCHQGYGEQTECRAPDSAPAQTLCTKACDTNADCSFGRATGAAPLCHDGVCRTVGFDCNDDNLPYECNGGLQCANLFGDVAEGGGSAPTICTIGCPGPRVSGHRCPPQFTCSPLLQAWNPPRVESFCVQGYPGIMPCRADSECWDVYRDGSQRCLSITNADPAVDGTCSVPCKDAADCQGVFDGDVRVFCLPGAPAPEQGQPGYCYANPSLDVLLHVNLGRQGALCDPSAPECEADLDCVEPYDVGPTAIGDLESRPYCARRCDGPADCPQSPVPHDCVAGSGVTSFPHCRPMRHDFGLSFPEPCLDHRECAWGVCYHQEADTRYGICTKVCQSPGDCPDARFPDAICNADAVCAPPPGGQLEPQ